MIQTTFQFAIEFQAAIHSQSNDVRIASCQLALLTHLLGANDRCGTIDNATADLSKSFGDDGRWRGYVTLGLHADGIIEPVGAEKSRRPSRNRGLIHRWRLVNADRAKDRINELQRCLEKQNPLTAGTVAGNSESSNTNSKTENGVTENASK